MIVKASQRIFLLLPDPDLSLPDSIGVRADFCYFRGARAGFKLNRQFEQELLKTILPDP